jgi:hypothetical protein
MKIKGTLMLLSSVIALFSAEKIPAQISVHEEPQHKIIFENEYVRLIDLTLRPNDTTLEHRHNVASVVVFLTQSKVAIKDAGKPPVITEVVPGNTVFRNYGETPVLHTVWIEDTSLFRCLVVEIMHDEPVEKIHVNLEDALTKLLWRQKLVDAYSLHMSTGQNRKLAKSDRAHLVICFSGKAGIEYSDKKQSLEAGGYAFFAPNEEIHMRADQGKPAECVLLTLN